MQFKLEGFTLTGDRIAYYWGSVADDMDGHAVWYQGLGDKIICSADLQG